MESDCSSPIQAVPVELLNKIFGLSTTRIVLDNFSKQNPALVLSHVSREWRVLATSTASLWSHLSITLDCTADQRESHGWPYLLELILERSKQTPLHLALDYFPDEHDSPTPPTLFKLGLLMQLIAHCHRWEVVSLNIPNEVLENKVFLPIRGSLPTLTSLMLNGESWDTDTPINLFMDCPNLRHLALELVLDSELDVQWDQLASLAFTSLISGDDVIQDGFMLKILPLCTKLTTFTLDWCTISGIESDRVITSIPCVSTSVTSLSILSICDVSNVVPFLQRLTLPCLDAFVLQGATGLSGTIDISSTVPSIRGFLARSSCSITLLSIKGVHFKTKDIVEILSAMPTLTSLTIHDVVVMQATIDSENSTSGSWRSVNAILS